MKVYYCIEKTARGAYFLKKIINYGFFGGATVVPVDGIPYASEQSARNAAAMMNLQIAKVGNRYQLI